MKSEHKKNAPRIIAFELTRKCRFNCAHCRADASNESQILTTSQCEKILESIADFNKSVVIMTGGEPTERDDIYHLISYGNRLGLKIVMATCGYTIDDAVMQKFKQAGLLAVSLSLDGDSAETHDAFRRTKGAFDITVAAAKIIKKSGIRFQINMTISKINVEQVTSVAKIAQKLGAYCFNPFVLVPTGRGIEIKNQLLSASQYDQLLKKLLEIKKEIPIELRVTCGPQFARICDSSGEKLSQSTSGCMGAKGFGFISYKGDVQICGFLDISAGNLIDNGFDFKKIWLQSEFLNEIRNRENFKGGCQRCQSVDLCGGCRARAYAATGDYMQSDPICGYLPNQN